MGTPTAQDREPRTPTAGAVAVAAAGFLAALAAMSIPEGSAQLSEIAAILSIGALALIAGHRWGLLVVAAADVVLVGAIWPVVVAQTPPATASGLAAHLALAGALPGLLVFPGALPGIVDLALGRQRSPRIRGLALHAGRAVGAAWLLAPAVSLAVG